MRNIARVLLFPVALWAAVIYSSYEIFHWIAVEGPGNWPQQEENPVQSATSLMRDFCHPRLSEQR